MQYRFTLCLLVFFVTLASFVRADYYIDDQNYTSLIFSENADSGPRWAAFREGGPAFEITLTNGTNVIIDASHCYNYTYSYGLCNSNADNCRIQIPFSGSGITIYVLQAGEHGTNASLAIDGGEPTYSILDAPSEPNLYASNVTLFSVQGLNTGNHTAAITALNWENIVTGVMFDYALINQTIVSAPTTGSGGLASPTALATATATSETTAMSTTPGVLPLKIGAIVEGVFGGLIALILIILAILYFRRRYRKVHDFGMNERVEPMVAPFVTGSGRPSMGYTTVPGHVTGGDTVTIPVRTQPPTQTTGSRSRRDKSVMALRNPSTSQVAEASIPSVVQGAPSNTDTAPEMSHARIRQLYPTLTDDQADFVNSLYAVNVSATAIARVIERMMAGEQRPTVDGYDSLPPPSYHHSTNDG